MRLRAPIRTTTAVAASAAALMLSSCSLAGGGSDDKAADTKDRVVLVTHDSFHLPDGVVKDFEKKSGLDLVVRSSGDAGALTTKLALTKDDPTGDVAFGVDNTFASRALDEGVFAEHEAHLPSGAETYLLPGDEGRRLTPVDRGSVCVNVDTTWFAAKGRVAPTSLDDLVKPEYKDLFVTPGATTSSPGLAFLLATVAKYGDGWPAYWQKLVANGVKITEGWEDAYSVDFTQGGGKGTRPVVVSYDSSPAFTVGKDGTSTTKALLDTCFTQVEYAGVLTGAKNPKGAGELVDFLLTPEVQKALPESMYVFPVDPATPLPGEWAKFATSPTKPLTVAPAAIDENRDAWLKQWSDVTSR